jgi:hypothetical protein
MDKTVLITIAIGLAACGGSTSQTETSETAGGEVSVQTESGPIAQNQSQRRGSGASIEDPISACGPRDSYTYVASEFKCPGGTNPLGGDPSLGQQARVGNVGANTTGHIIDLYRIECPNGPVEVYVDMYGCPEAEGLLGGP